MTIEDQVCSLELAKKLKELGVKQVSLFFYFEDRVEAHAHHSFENRLYLSNEEINSPDQKYASAFTVAELGEMLPTGIWSGKQNDEKIVCWNQTFQKTLDEDIEFYGDTEADARAKMLIYLLENKLITL